MTDIPTQTFHVRLYVAQSFEADIEAATEAEAHQRARANLRQGKGEGFAKDGGRFILDPSLCPCARITP